MYLNHVHILKNVIFQEVLHIVYFKIIPTISQKIDSNFLGPKLAHTLYSPLYICVFPWVCVQILFYMCISLCRCADVVLHMCIFLRRSLDVVVCRCADVVLHM